ncbi:MAG: NTP transferase domain-containing protein [Lentisphaeria bacterium]|nr:NTP transferase domain-containing protein [Lentisphaeria bacterium]
MDRSVDLFVPGRVCLFGEHSDWAGAYRRFNSNILPGRVIIAGTNQGIHARVRPRKDRFVYHASLPDGRRERVDLPMSRDALLKTAREGGFFSYAAGVAYHIRTFYEVEGIEIDNYRTDMPVKKGLSSSAALCVLVARAFNRVYDLKLTIRAEMEAAYQGEILTPSRCGRMDQGCAFGQVPVMMTFDGDLLHTTRLPVGAHFHLLIADLKGKKDTIRILADLNRAYPFPEEECDHAVHAYLGGINADLVARAAEALKSGDAPTLGKLMTEAQEAFDKHLVPACPTELTAHKLHAALADPRVQELTYGGKGVGSQGDGCVQFVARNAAARAELAQHLTRTMGMECFELDLAPPELVRKAVIPAAGFGTRMFPATKAVKKELFPVVTPDGQCKPILLTIVEEALNSGIEEVAIIVRAGDEATYEQLFRAPLAPEHFNKLPERARRSLAELADLGRRVTFIPQPEQLGFGHAVFCARDWVGKEPFLLLLGDHIYASNTEEPCARQLLNAFKTGGMTSVVAVYLAAGTEVQHYGTVTGSWIDEAHSLLNIREFAEKPSIDYARSNLTTEGLPPDTFVCVYGQYVLTPAIFEILERQIQADQRQAGEIQLTTALDCLRREEGVLAFLVQGEHFDTGLPESYLRSLVRVYERRRTGEAP